MRKAVCLSKQVVTFAISIVLYLSPTLVFAQNEASPNLELKEAMDLALQNNPLLLETIEKVNQADTEVPLARAGILPNVYITGAANKEKDSVSFGSPRFDGDSYNQYSASLKFSQLLFQVGSISAISSAKKDYDISKLNVQISSRDLSNNVIQAFYQIVLDARNIQTLQKQQKIVHESLAVAQRRERNGRGQLLDVLQVKTQLALLEGQISTAQNQFQISAANLAFFLGDNKRTQIRIKDKLEAPDIAEVDKSMNLKNYHIPEIDRDIVSIEKIQDLKNIALGQNLPFVSLVGDYTYNSYKQADLINDSAASWGIGVQLTIPIFSGFSSIYQQKSLISQQVQLEQDKRNVENQVNLQQITSRKNLETAKDSIVTGTEALKLALASSKEAIRNYNNATIDFLQLLVVQQAFVQAEQSLNSYKYNYIVALGNYYAASGQDMNQLVTSLEKANQ